VGARSDGEQTDVAESSLIEVGTGPCCLVPDDDGIWVMNHRDYSLQRVDPQTNQPDKPVSVYPYNKMIGAGDNILLEEPNAVALFDPQTRKVGQPIPIAGGMRGMAFDPTTNTLWVGSATGGTLTHIDADSGRVLDTFRVDGLPSGGSLISTGRNELWVGPFTGGLLKIDLARQRVVALLEQAPFGIGAFAVVSAGGYL
jgi:DNA-binding beta-propeller fold protein YncE